MFKPASTATSTSASPAPHHPSSRSGSLQSTRSQSLKQPAKSAAASVPAISKEVSKSITTPVTPSPPQRAAAGGSASDATGRFTAAVRRKSLAAGGSNSANSGSSAAAQGSPSVLAGFAARITTALRRDNFVLPVRRGEQIIRILQGIVGVQLRKLLVPILLLYLRKRRRAVTVALRSQTTTSASTAALVEFCLLHPFLNPLGRDAMLRLLSPPCATRQCYFPEDVVVAPREPARSVGIVVCTTGRVVVRLRPRSTQATPLGGGGAFSSTNAAETSAALHQQNEILEKLKLTSLGGMLLQSSPAAMAMLRGDYIGLTTPPSDGGGAALDSSASPDEVVLNAPLVIGSIRAMTDLSNPFLVLASTTVDAFVIAYSDIHDVIAGRPLANAADRGGPSIPSQQKGVTSHRRSVSQQPQPHQPSPLPQGNPSGSLPSSSRPETPHQQQPSKTRGIVMAVSPSQPSSASVVAAAAAGLAPIARCILADPSLYLIPRMMTVQSHYGMSDFLLKQSWLFSITPADMQLLVSFKLECHSFAPGEVICEKGKPCAGVWYVRRGRVSIVGRNPNDGGGGAASAPANGNRAGFGKSAAATTATSSAISSGLYSTAYIFPGSTIGERGALFHERNRETLVAHTFVDMWLLPAAELNRFRGHAQLENVWTKGAVAVATQWLQNQRLEEVRSLVQDAEDGPFRTAVVDALRVGRVAIPSALMAPVGGLGWSDPSTMRTPERRRPQDLAFRSPPAQPPLSAGGGGFTPRAPAGPPPLVLSPFGGPLGPASIPPQLPQHGIVKLILGIRSVPYLQSAPPELIWQLCACAEPRVFMPHTAMSTTSEWATQLFVIAKGQATAQHGLTSRPPPAHYPWVYGPGSCVGMECVVEHRSLCPICTVSTVEAWVIPSGVLRAMMSEYHCLRQAEQLVEGILSDVRFVLSQQREKGSTPTHSHPIRLTASTASSARPPPSSTASSRPTSSRLARSRSPILVSGSEAPLPEDAQTAANDGSSGSKQHRVAVAQRRPVSAPHHHASSSTTGNHQGGPLTVPAAVAQHYATMSAASIAASTLLGHLQLVRVSESPSDGGSSWGPDGDISAGAAFGGQQWKLCNGKALQGTDGNGDGDRSGAEAAAAVARAARRRGSISATSVAAVAALVDALASTTSHTVTVADAPFLVDLQNPDINRGIYPLQECLHFLSSVETKRHERYALMFPEATERICERRSEREEQMRRREMERHAERYRQLAEQYLSNPPSAGIDGGGGGAAGGNPLGAGGEGVSGPNGAGGLGTNASSDAATPTTSGGGGANPQNRERASSLVVDSIAHSVAATFDEANEKAEEMRKRLVKQKGEGFTWDVLDDAVTADDDLGDDDAGATDAGGSRRPLAHHRSTQVFMNGKLFVHKTPSIFVCVEAAELIGERSCWMLLLLQRKGGVWGFLEGSQPCADSLVPVTATQFAPPAGTLPGTGSKRSMSTSVLRRTSVQIKNGATAFLSVGQKASSRSPRTPLLIVEPTSSGGGGGLAPPPLLALTPSSKRQHATTDDGGSPRRRSFLTAVPSLQSSDVISGRQQQPQQRRPSRTVADDGSTAVATRSGSIPKTSGSATATGGGGTVSRFKPVNPHSYQAEVPLATLMLQQGRGYTARMSVVALEQQRRMSAFGGPNGGGTIAENRRTAMAAAVVGLLGGRRESRSPAAAGPTSSGATGDTGVDPSGATGTTSSLPCVRFDEVFSNDVIQKVLLNSNAQGASDELRASARRASTANGGGRRGVVGFSSSVVEDDSLYGSTKAGTDTAGDTATASNYFEMEWNMMMRGEGIYCDDTQMQAVRLTAALRKRARQSSNSSHASQQAKAADLWRQRRKQSNAVRMALQQQHHSSYIGNDAPNGDPLQQTLPLNASLSVSGQSAALASDSGSVLSPTSNSNGGVGSNAVVVAPLDALSTPFLDKYQQYLRQAQARLQRNTIKATHELSDNNPASGGGSPPHSQSASPTAMTRIASSAILHRHASRRVVAVPKGNQPKGDGEEPELSGAASSLPCPLPTSSPTSGSPSGELPSLSVSSSSGTLPCAQESGTPTRTPQKGAVSLLVPAPPPRGRPHSGAQRCPPSRTTHSALVMSTAASLPPAGVQK